MSNKALTWAFSLNLKSGPKFVLVALADYADEENSCYPSYDKIERKTGIAKKTITDHLAALEAIGLIQRTRQRYDDGNLGGYRYKLNLTTDNQNIEGSSIAKIKAKIRGKITPPAKLACDEPPAKSVKTTCKFGKNHLLNQQDNNHQNNHQKEPSDAKAKLTGYFDTLTAKLKNDLTVVGLSHLGSKRELSRVQLLGADMPAVINAIVSYYHDPAVKGRDPQFKVSLERVIRERLYEPFIGSKPAGKPDPVRMRELYHKHDTGKLTDIELNAEIEKLRTEAA